jgi:hypothetical protein
VNSTAQPCSKLTPKNTFASNKNIEKYKQNPCFIVKNSDKVFSKLTLENSEFAECKIGDFTYQMKFRFTKEER